MAEVNDNPYCGDFVPDIDCNGGYDEESYEELENRCNKLLADSIKLKDACKLNCKKLMDTYFHHYLTFGSGHPLIEMQIAIKEFEEGLDYEDD